MATGETYEVKLKYELGGQSMLNIFHYTQTSGTDNADNLGDLWSADVLDQIQANVSDEVHFVSLEVRNLEVPTDFDSRSLDDYGLRGGDWFSTNVAWSFQYVTNRLDARDGGKRFGGVCETDVVNGEPTVNALIRLTVLGNQLNANLSSANGAWRPNVKGKRKGQVGTFANFMSAVQFRGVFTQNTRKTYTRGLF